MAQRSKKDQIADAALGLFLEHGIKGTSVDMVVKTSGVSKPTVYNHFPDKATLMLHVVECWLKAQTISTFTSKTLNTLSKELNRRWLTDDNIRLYGLLMGEGFRAPQARDLFKSKFDTPWRQTLSDWGSMHDCQTDELNALVNKQIIGALL